MQKMRHCAVGLIALALVGCSSPVQRVDPDKDDQIGGTGLDSADVRAMSDQMARSLLGCEEIFKQGTPRVFVKGIRNDTRFFVDPGLLVQSIRGRLMESASGRIRFLAREDLDAVLAEREAKRSGAVAVTTDAAGEPRLREVSGADYILTGTLSGISKTTGADASDYLVASFRLVDSETADLVWAGSYEVKKVGEEGVVYR
jgi:PBP1b-binding outer membrane lipoprotein LpoB